MVEGQRVTASVEGAAKRFGIIACRSCTQHFRDSDVLVEQEVLTAVACASGYIGAQLAPLVRRVDEVWVLGGTIAASEVASCTFCYDSLCKSEQEDKCR